MKMISESPTVPELLLTSMQQSNGNPHFIRRGCLNAVRHKAMLATDNRYLEHNLTSTSQNHHHINSITSCHPNHLHAETICHAFGKEQHKC